MLVSQRFTDQDGLSIFMSKPSSIAATWRIVPGLAGDPAVGGEQTDRPAAAIHRYRDEMADQIVRDRFRLEVGQRCRLHAGRHAAAAHEGMEMAVLARPVLLVVRVVVPLGVALGIEHVALRVVIEDVEGGPPA